MYQKDGEKVCPPYWWPSHVAFEGISDVMRSDNVRDAYEAGRQYYMNRQRDQVKLAKEMLMYLFRDCIYSSYIV